MKFPAITVCFIAQWSAACVVATIVCAYSALTKAEAVVSVVLCAAMTGYWTRDYMVSYVEDKCLAANKDSASPSSHSESTAKIEGVTDGY